MGRGVVGLALALACGCASVEAPAGDGPPPEKTAVGYRRVDIGVATGEPGPEASQIRVVLSRASAIGFIPKTPKPEDCLVVDDTTRVTIDGVALELEHPGGMGRGQQISGVDLPGHCRPAQFRSPPGHVFEVHERSRVVVAHEGWRAVMKVDDLTAQRRVSVTPNGPVRPGDRITLSWSPRTDDWDGYDASTGVRLWQPEGNSVHIEVPKLHAEPPDFSFDVPPLEPGEYQVDLALVYLRPQAKVRSCRGAHHCSASVGWLAESPMLTVL